MAIQPDYTISREMVINYLTNHGIEFNKHDVLSWDLSVGVETEFFLAIKCPKTNLLKMLTNEKKRDAIVHKTAMELGKIFREKYNIDQKWLNADSSYKLVDSEYWVCMIETGTPESLSIPEQRRVQRIITKTLINVARQENVYVMAISTPPNKQRGWQPSNKHRYDQLRKYVGPSLRQFKVAGVHTHVCVGNEFMRIVSSLALTNIVPFVTGLTASSPIFCGELTNQIASRPSKWRNFRSDIPKDAKILSSVEGYKKALKGLLIDIGSVAPGFLTHVDNDIHKKELPLKQQLVNAAGIFWTIIRANQKYDTSELRAAETTPYIDDSLAMTAMYRAFIRYVIRHPEYKMHDAAILSMNIKAVEDEGRQAMLIDNAGNKNISFTDSLYEFLEMIKEDAEALGDWNFINNQVKIIMERGNVAEKLIHTWHQNNPQNFTQTGQTTEAQQAAMEWIIQETENEAFANFEL